MSRGGGRPIGGARRLVSDERWDRVNQPAARRAPDRDVVRCLTCGARCELDARGNKPRGWSRLYIEGFDVEGYPAPGSYCSPDCHVVAALGPYGLSEAQVRTWLAGDGSVP